MGNIKLAIGVVSVVVVSWLNEVGLIDLMPLLYGAVGFAATFGSGFLLGLGCRAQANEVDGLTIWTQKK